MNKGLFLDRDGVINIDNGHVHRIEDFELREEIFEIVRLANRLNFKVVVVTNQAGIGRGLYTTEQFQILDRFMHEEFRKRGGLISRTYFCPYHPEYGIGFLLQNSYDRKPNPGMLVKACRDFTINPKFSVMIGDQPTDHLAAQRLGITRYVNATRHEWLATACNALYF